MPEINFELTFQIGPLKAGFRVNLEGNYIVLVGPNNAAKTSILQAIFRTRVPYDASQNTSETCLILPERIFVDTTTQTGTTTLEYYNQQLAATMQSSSKSYQGLTGPLSNELPKLLLNHSNFIAQVYKLNEFLEYFGLPNLVLRGAQQVTFDQVQVAFQGSGLRSILAILAALTDDQIKLLLIDEPELSLEAGLQKLLRDLLYKASREKQIIITTHSHLFLNRTDSTSNYVVKKEKEEVHISPVSSEPELYEITFNMLGSSVEDLFFPRNFLIVEGATDQIIVNRVMELKDIDKTKIKVVSASGIDKMHHILSAIYNALLPLVLTSSPYKDRVVALIDKVADKTSQTYAKIQGNLPDRLFELDAPSLEEYLPEGLYTQCSRNKDEDLKEIKRKEDYLQKMAFKTQIAHDIAKRLRKKNLKDIPIIVNAVDKANV